jgi:acetylornithine deacetylase/succinyl-diaminopimelate desuccinylase-like protein
MDVNGIWGGFTGEGAKTVIPFEARAKISMRLVPGQEPKKILENFKDYLRRFENDGIKIEVEWSESAPAFLANSNDPVFAKAQEVYEEVFGTKALLTRTGGTIGLLSGLDKLFGKPVLLMNFGLPDENMHAPNEFMRVSNFIKGIEVSLKLWSKLK